MTYSAKFQTIIQLHDLISINILRIGYFSFHVQLLLDSNNIIDANKKKPLTQSFSKDAQQSEPNTSEESETNVISSWQSSTFPVRYLQQTIKIDQHAQFQMSINCLPALDKYNFILRFTLLFQKFTDYQGQILNLQKNAIQTVEIQLINAQFGIFHYYQAYFSGQYLSKFSFTCLCLTTGFYFKPKKQVSFLKKHKKTKSQKLQQQQLMKVQDLGELINWYEKFRLAQFQGIQYFYQKFAKNFRSSFELLKMRINHHKDQKTQDFFRLPKFIDEQQRLATPKDFFQKLNNFNGSKLTLQGYEQQLLYLNKSSRQLVLKTSQDWQNHTIDIKKLKQEFQKHQEHNINWRMIKQTIKQGNKQSRKQISQIKDSIKGARQNMKSKFWTSYPISNRCVKPVIFLKYDFCYTNKTQEKIQKLTKQANNYNEYKMLIVICHGFQSSASDMRMIKRGIQKILPNALILVSKANEIHTNGCIKQMGERLANQIYYYLKTRKLDIFKIVLNFVGHSMGGIIARASLKYFSPLFSKFGFFCSIGTPHLGYLNGGLSTAGLWFARNFINKQSLSLEQLSMKQQRKPKLSVLFQLSKSGTLTLFTKIILISSIQDKFVPWHSAQISYLAGSSPKSKNILQQMAQNILGEKIVHRIDVNFNFPKNSISSFIGQKAHLSLITQHQLIQLIAIAIPDLFDLTYL